jgi:hypothetical protein
MRRALALVLFVVAVAGCGGGGGNEAATSTRGPAAAQLVANAAAKTADAGTSRTAFTITMTGFAAEPAKVVGEGIFDSQHRRGRVTFDLSQLGEAAGGQDLGKAEMIVDDLVVYMRWPFLRRLNPKIKEWLKFDLKAFGKQQGVDLGQLSQLEQSDPSQALAYLRAVGNDVRAVGEDDVRGAATTHYTMTVDLRKVASVAPPEQRAQVKASIDQIIAKSGVREVPAEVWIDEDGLVRREKLEFRDFTFAPGQTGDMTMTMDLFDFGVEVHVKPPPANEVTDIQGLLGGGG